MKRNHLLGLLVAAAAITITGGVLAQSKVEVPAHIAPKLEGLSKEKRDFLLSDDSIGISGSERKLFQRLERLSPAEIEAYIDGMMQVVAAGRFNPKTDMAAIPLNTEAEDFNSWKVRRPATMDPKREPGPFRPSWYASGRSGIATFANAPIAVYPEDLVAGKVDVAIVGAPLDMGSGYRGAKDAPSALRAMQGASRIDMYTAVNPSRELNIVDYGDIAVDNMSTELTVHHVRERVAEIARTGAIPFIIGGDHSLEYPNIAGLADVHGKNSFGVIHFDSHYDAGKASVHFITHGQPVYRAVKEGHVDPRNFIQIGLRGGWPGKDGFEWMRDNGMRYHTMPTIEKKGWPAVMEQALKEAREGGKKLYVSFDVDVLDPAFVPGTGTPVPGGLTMREAITIVRRMCAENEIVGFDLVEVAPMLDSTYRTALNANFIMHACLTGIAMRKTGIKDIGYFSELTTEHKQPESGIRGEKEGRRDKVDPFYARPDLRPKPAASPKR